MVNPLLVNSVAADESKSVEKDEWPAEYSNVEVAKILICTQIVISIICAIIFIKYGNFSVLYASFSITYHLAIFNCEMKYFY